MLLRLLCCDDVGWRELGPGARARSFRGIVALLNGSGGAHYAATSRGCQRLRAAAALPTNCCRRRSQKYCFDRGCVCLTPTSLAQHTHTHTHQSPTTEVAAALYSVASTAMVLSAPI